MYSLQRGNPTYFYCDAMVLLIIRSSRAETQVSTRKLPQEAAEVLPFESGLDLRCRSPSQNHPRVSRTLGPLRGIARSRISASGVPNNHPTRDGILASSYLDPPDCQDYRAERANVSADHAQKARHHLGHGHCSVCGLLCLARGLAPPFDVTLKRSEAPVIAPRHMPTCCPAGKSGQLWRRNRDCSLPLWVARPYTARKSTSSPGFPASIAPSTSVPP